MDECVTRAEFSKMAGVSKPAITKAVNTGRLPLNEDDLIDLGHPDCVAYLARHCGITEYIPPTPATGKKAKKQAAVKKTGASELAARRRTAMEAGKSGGKIKPGMGSDTDMGGGTGVKEAVRSKTNREIVARRKIEMKKLEGQALAINLKNEEAVGRVIPRDLVQRAILEPLETEQVRLLSDGANSIVALLFPAIRGNCTPEEAEKIVREQLSAFIKARKRTIIRMLKNTPYEGSPSSGADAGGSGVQDG